MSHLLWKYYWEQDVDKFRRLLAPGTQNAHPLSKSPGLSYDGGFLAKSPGAPAGSPRAGGKTRRVSGFTPGKHKDSANLIGRPEINSRDHSGLTLLLRAAISTDPTARDFICALLEHPSIDLYAQDPESGWNALHRALYAGNVSIARMLLRKERAYLTSHHMGSVGRVGQLIKTKDKEGNSPFDVYNSTVATRSLQEVVQANASDSDSESGDDGAHTTSGLRGNHSHLDFHCEGDELFVFGSNKNMSLGVGDEDDRQFPERIHLRRPDSLLHTLYAEYCDRHGLEEPDPSLPVTEIPTMVREQPLVIKDMVMAKLHSAILTDDPVSNLYVCGVGRGGRLGLGDENTQFRFVPVQGPLTDKKIHQVALGQNHTLAVADNGELWTWGLNTESQLGYTLPPPTKVEEEPMCVTPRQVFGPLKKEVILGVAASAIHSVAHTGSSLFCWGRNNGQLALMDSDSRSMDVQQSPRKVAASLLSSPIVMVSAIDKATTCLLSNHTVWVFTNYGYNLVKFPVPDVFANFNISASFSNRYEPGRNKIGYVTSGGETIAAVTRSGDLFTMQLNQKAEAHQMASTTNPTKIKGALSQPQCIWDSRKDGAMSVNVGEHGSVIICTESGAVWKRVKRNKGKGAAFVGSELRRNDFKFERVPYITDCVSARSSTFGAFAAIRKDSKVMSEQIKVQEKSLWRDVASLLGLDDFKAGLMELNAYRPWDGSSNWELPPAFLKPEAFEDTFAQWLRGNARRHEDADMFIESTSVPNLRVPAHSFVFAGRSSILRQAFAAYRNDGVQTESDCFVLEEAEGKLVLRLVNADFLTLLNLVTFAYQDAMVPVWRYTREAPAYAFRFRQVRTEVMKLATKLDLAQLEAAARLQRSMERSLDTDFRVATEDPLFYEDADVVLELDGDEVPAHSSLLCQRCPFFEGMFNGRSQGGWLAGRLDQLGSEHKVRVDLAHVSPDTFYYVLQHIYCDAGSEMFDEVAAGDIDDFSELILDVMSVANELMLDRLAQTCQSIIGKFVTTRNIANLLNEISPCVVTDFKDTGLEYICLQLESMLENHLLEDLDEDLVHELDEIVRENQLARLPIGRSGRAELVLHDKYPELVAEIEEERRIRIKELAYRAVLKDDDRKGSSSIKSPSLRPKSSMADMIFDMDEDRTPGRPAASPMISGSLDNFDLDMEHVSQLPKSWQQARDRATQSPLDTTPLGVSPLFAARSPPNAGGKPWASAAQPMPKLGLKDILSEVKPASALSAGLAGQAKGPPVPTDKLSNNAAAPKLSQKERKKQMQLQAAAEAAEKNVKSQQVPWETVPSGSKPATAPWKAAAPASKMSMKDAMSAEFAAKEAVAASAKPLIASEASPASSRSKVRTASPDTRFSGQSRTNSSPIVPSASTPQQKEKPLVPHSKSYMTPARKTEDFLGASMSDIIGQQAREQQKAKEAVAKRSLQEIQQEQEFQAWWDQESRRAQEEEARRLNKGSGKEQSDKPAQRGRRGRNHKPRGKTEVAEASENVGNGTPTGANRGARGARGRGRKT
ncbi:BTB domain and ankyrin repeat-containing protein [Emericellopsis atlantica]|uniref:BTB domain and ankyrin repeat-containing protein n=1 Tax=Emericellopsis atlantica TaxID=2614577 RepID=A0A9P8CLQ7_9HYPO|nr:BTB domain and ankyrin repeat-containing protein [Emericellopsis atlantica]KAG9251307.1 BTB domain and ankyrin repeat-containing protein [Emericellopsis atlantica]